MTFCVSKARGEAPASSRYVPEFGGPKLAQRSSLLAGLEGDAAQAQRVADHADGADAHRSTRDHRVEQQTEYWIDDAGGDRYRERVEHEGEEQVSPAKRPILLLGDCALCLDR